MRRRTRNRLAARGHERLATELHRLRDLMQQAPGFVAIGRGPEHVIELANHAFYQLVGHREIVGKAVREALPELEGQGFCTLLDHVYRTAEPFIGRAVPIEFQQEPGAELARRYVDFVYQPILDGNGCVSGIFVQGHDVTEAHELAQKVGYQAAHDALTGLANRREFDHRLCDALGRLHGSDLQHALLYIDLDQFKVVNDTCGHGAGDELLCRISGVLAEGVRDLAAVPHVLARLGGDEFALLLERCSEEDACRIAEGLRVQVQKQEFVFGRRVFGCTISVGVVGFAADPGSAEQVMSAADTACFLAKEKGRNRIQVHRPEDDELAQRHRDMDWVSRLRSALNEHRLVLYAQDIAPLAPGPHPIRRREVLVRLRDVDGRLVSPMAFIPAAERYGLMPTVDRYLIDRAFAYLQGLAPEARACLQLSINVSGTTLNDDGFLDFVRERLAETGLDPAHVCFEITETAAVAHLTRTASLVGRLRDLGVRFALDDFGSGMSSLNYLKHLPVDYLKIDGSFVRHVVEDPVDAAIVEAIARVAQVLGIRTVAEYVENEAIRSRLAGMGVDFAQGYAVHRPEPLEP